MRWGRIGVGLLLAVWLAGGCSEGVPEGTVREQLAIGDARMREGKYVEALRAYGQASDLAPEDPEPLRRAALALVVLRRDEAAATNFETATELGGPIPTSDLLFWATALQRLGRTEQAIARYREALQAEPDNASALNNLGILLAGQENSADEGVHLLERTVRLRPGEPNFLYNLGRAYQKVGRDEEAIDLIQRAVAATPEHDPSYAPRAKRLRQAKSKLARAPAPADAPNVLLVVIDTLRADHVGAYGYARPTTPHLDALAREGIVFENAVSQAPWTAASVATMLTGLTPSVHGLDGGVQWGAGQQSAGGTLPFAVQKVLGPSRQTLAEILRRHGYGTAAFVSNVYMNSIFGFGQGFEVYDDEHEDYSKDVAHVKRRAEATNQRAFRWIEEQAQEPFFLLVHYNDPHWPYVPPEDYGKDFVAGYQGRLTPKDTFEVVSRQGKPITDLDPEDLAYIVGLYDGEVAYADAQLGRLLAELRGQKLTRPLATLVTADHGEEFLDHGSMSHGYTLYEEQIHVPLILHHPTRMRPRRVPPPVRLVDLVPTVLDLAGIDEQPPALQGMSLVPLASGTTMEGPAEALSEATFPDLGAQKSLRTSGGLKWIQNFDHDTGWLFDLRQDPGEQHDLAARNAKGAEDLRARLRVHISENRALHARLRPKGGEVEEVVLDEQAQEKLRSLGYVE